MDLERRLRAVIDGGGASVSFAVRLNKENRVVVATDGYEYVVFGDRTASYDESSLPPEKPPTQRASVDLGIDAFGGMGE